MNNFDTSSNGIDIEFTVSYDTDLSQIYFEEFKHEAHVIYDRRRDPSAYLLGNFEKDMWTISQLKRMTKAELYELACEIGDIYNDIENYTKQELIENYLEGITIARYYEMVGTSNPIHSNYDTHGYSQGDCVTIIDCDEPASKPFTKEQKEYCDHIFWDAPVYGNFEIGGVEFRYDEICNDYYDWDKNIVINYVKELKDDDIQENLEYVVNFLNNNLPEHPEYRN